METLQEIQAKHDELEAALKAFKDLEQDKQLEQISDIEAKTEEFEKVKAELQSAKIKAAEAMNNRISGALANQNTGPDLPENGGIQDRPRVTIPAKARATRKLRAFQSEESAYCAGRWYAANVFGHGSSREWLNNHQVFDTAYSENNDQKGGIFVPHEISMDVIRLVEDFSIPRRECRIEPMGSDTKTVPVRTGGMTAYWVGESDQNSQPTGTASSADYKPCNLVAKKLKAWTRVSDELNEDSLIQIAELIALESAQAIASAEEDALFNGDGTNTYGGILGLKSSLGSASVFQMGAGDGAFADVVLADLDSTMALLPNYPGIMPKWYVSRYGWHACFQRLLNASGGSSNASLADGNSLNYNGYPVVFAEKLFGAAGDTSADEIIAFFGDLSMGVLLGDRRSMTMSVDDSRYWDSDQIGIKMTTRVDIKVHSPGDATNPGPIVALKTDIS